MAYLPVRQPDRDRQTDPEIDLEKEKESNGLQWQAVHGPTNSAQ